MLPSPYGCRLGPREYYFSRPQRVHCCYGPVTRNLPWEGLVDRLRRFCFHLLRYPNYGALTSTPAGLSPAEHASLHWTHDHTGDYTLMVGVADIGDKTGTSTIKLLDVSL